MKTYFLLAITLLITTPALADPTADARAHSEAFQKAFNSGDADAVVRLYDEHARLIWPGEGDEATGKAEIRKVVVATFKALPGATQVMKSQSVIPLGCGYSAVIGHWEISFKDAGGKMQMAPVRTSEIIKKQGTKTLYIVDHASVALPPPPPETTPAPKASR
jgi:ketosteroid isomerase-like protein